MIYEYTENGQCCSYFKHGTALSVLKYTERSGPIIREWTWGDKRSLTELTLLCTLLLHLYLKIDGLVWENTSKSFVSVDYTKWMT